METCRCGYTGQGDHPCHGGMYTCGKGPAKERFVAHPAALAGMQMKFGAYTTWACDDCWEEYRSIVAKVRGAG